MTADRRLPTVSASPSSQIDRKALRLSGLDRDARLPLPELRMREDDFMPAWRELDFRERGLADLDAVDVHCRPRHRIDLKNAGREDDAERRHRAADGLDRPRQIDAHAAIDDAQVVGTWCQLHPAVPARADLLPVLEDFHGHWRGDRDP